MEIIVKTPSNRCCVYKFNPFTIKDSKLVYKTFFLPEKDSMLLRQPMQINQLPFFTAVPIHFVGNYSHA